MVSIQPMSCTIGVYWSTTILAILKGRLDELSARPSYQPVALSYIRSVVKTADPINVVEYGLPPLSL
jgi:hypothetical protein